jgi:hypothetical protein
MASTCILVLGMHRSGTSALTRCLNLLGMDLGANLIAPEAMNSKGFWEHADAVRINSDLLQSFGMYWRSLGPLPKDWLSSEAAEKARKEISQLIKRDFFGVPLWGIKDPRMCRLAPLWLEVLNSLEITTKVVIVVRSPLEVAASLKKAHAQLADEQLNVFSWVQHVAESEVATRGLVRTLVEYDDLMSDPDRVLGDIGDSLNIDWPISIDDRRQAIHAFLDVGLRTHYKAEKTQSMPIVARRMMDACGVLAKNRKFDDWSALSGISDEVMETTHLVGILESMYLHKSNHSAVHAVFYFAQGDETFQEADAVLHDIPYGRSQLQFALPRDNAKSLRFRFDPVDQPGCCLLRSFVVVNGEGQIIWDYQNSRQDIELIGIHCIPSFTEEDVHLFITNDDPQILFRLPKSLSLDGACLQVDIERLSDAKLSPQLKAADTLRQVRKQEEHEYMMGLESWEEKLSINARQAHLMELSLENAHVQLQTITKRVSELEELRSKAESIEVTIHGVQSRLDDQDVKVRDVMVGESGLDQLNSQVQALTEEMQVRKNWLRRFSQFVKK